MDGCRLLVRKLPSFLRSEEKESLIKYFGAVEVTVMAEKGMMKNSVFASFASPIDAKMAMTKLHQLNVFGSCLVVVYATSKDLQLGSVEDKWECSQLKKDTEVEANKHNLITQRLHEPSPNLTYLYPPPDQLIISNIGNAIACIPKLYVQVLHLMNKMNLPPPFGPPTPATILPPGPSPLATMQPLFKEEIENDDEAMLSSGESEIQSEEENERRVKRPEKVLKSGQRKARAIKRSTSFKQMKEVDTLPPVKVPKFEDAFPNFTLQKKIEIKTPTEINTTSQSPAVIENVFLISEMSKSESLAEVSISCDSEQNQIIQDSNVESTDENTFITLSELQQQRATKEEMSTFKNYETGEPSMRLYVKNLSKQVSEKDLKYIYGRYINWNSEADVNSFDIRVMQHGRMKGQAFIGMPSEETAGLALQETNGYKLHGRPMVVQFARSTKAKDIS